MERIKRLYYRLRRRIAFLMAMVLTFQSFFGFNIASVAAETEGRGSTFAYYDSSNLLKPGSSFPFYGKNHNRVGLWPYGITNVENGNPAAGFCLEPNKSMRSGTGGTIVTYDLDIDGDSLPLGMSREEAEILWYALSSSGNFEGYQANVEKMGQGHYILGQAATWAIMSGNWAGLDDFRAQMEVLMANLKSPVLAAETRGALEQFFNQTNEAVQVESVAPFVSKYKSNAPVHQMEKQEDGTHSITLSYGEGADWRQKSIVYDLPEGWSVTKNADSITFLCTTGNPSIGLVKGHFEEGSGAAQYWVKPNTFKIWYPDGWSESSAVEGMQAMITMAGEQQTWEVWLSFGEGGGGTTAEQSSGAFDIPYTQYLHEETFKRDYKVELTKLCDETEKPLEGATFEVLEQFDFSQLDGTNLEVDQFYENKATAEGAFEDLNVCQSSITTDQDGHFEHSDKKTYSYVKTYCGGHPEPEIEEVEISEDATEEEEAAAEEENERLAEEAQAAWQACVDWCEENCDFHSIDEGVARDSMEADRDEAWETFIRLERTYTVREVQARNGYILHDLHNDDVQVEIVTFASSQAEGDGTVVGRYPGNLNGRAGRSIDSNESLQVSVSSNELPLLRAAASPANAEPIPEEIKESDHFEVKQGDDSDGELSESTFEDVLIHTPSNLPEQIGAASTIYPVVFPMSIRASNEEEDEVSGSWEWNGVQEESQVTPISQSSYESNHTGYAFVVRDHRTEGELHINKRDLELYADDSDGSYGKTQGDATLEGAVYGLYASEDIIHPDGKTGKVFSAGELVSIATTDKNGDASFLVITEISETSNQLTNRYAENEIENGNEWIGRPLILGSYYVEEIARSEGYELSKTGKNLTESNRLGVPVVLSESGSANTDGFYHQINEWDGKSYDFEVRYFDTKGFDIHLMGVPEGSKLYEVTTTEKTESNQVIAGTERVEKKDESGNIIYQTAVGGEYKVDSDGNKIVKTDGSGNLVYSDEPLMVTVSTVNRLHAYVEAIERSAPSDPSLETQTEMDEDYITGEVNDTLRNSGFKGGLTEAPWMMFPLSGTTNGEKIEEILQFCASDSFWDAYEVEELINQSGTWYAKIRYAYKALASQSAVFEASTGRLAVKQSYTDGYYYVIYAYGDYERTGNQFTIPKRELDLDALETGTIQLKDVYRPVYETYAAGEYLLGADGEKIPVMETVPIYKTIETSVQEETLSLIASVYANGEVTATVDTEAETFPDGEKTKVFRIIVDQDIQNFPGAAVSVSSKKPELDAGSYLEFVTLKYPGQYEIHEDDDTRQSPVIVFERVIKQAIQVTKDIALDSYENNTYEIHRDPFTVLFGGYNGKQETKTLPGFYFKLYLRSELEDTGDLTKKADGAYDYVAFFETHPEYADSLAWTWDIPKYDADGDPKTVHANRGGGMDDYWGQSIMLPYGTYVIVEQQPTEMPQKSYEIDTPKEVEIPFIPQIDADGTVHDKISDPEYLYDSTLTPEELEERYLIRFNEETHVIKAHNHDGDFEVFKYGLEPDMKKSCQNEVVGSYYHYGSVSEDAGAMDDVYYETYYDRSGVISDYGVTLDDVATMTGISTAIDRKFSKALIPWRVLDPRFGEVINDKGDIGNREAGLEENGTFNFISFANSDFENELYGSRLRIEKLDAETGENILHDGALFKIYAAKRDVMGVGAGGVMGTGSVLFDESGIPLYDEKEQIFLQDHSGAEVGIFKAYSTVRDDDVTSLDGSVHTEKQTVGYLETYEPLGAGAYVLVEVDAPEGYVKSPPIAFEVYSDKVEYYADGKKENKTEAVKYQYMRPIGTDGKTILEDAHQIIVKDKPTHIEIHKVEKENGTITYRVDGDEKQLRARGDVTLQYLPNGTFAGFGYVTKTLGGGNGVYVPNATLTLYKGLKVTQTDVHEYEGVTVKRNLFDSVTSITAHETGVDTDIRQTGTDSVGRDEWDITDVRNPAVELWRFDLEYDPTELDEATGMLYGLDDWGNRICMLDSETGMAYVTDEEGTIIVWPLDEYGDKIISESVEVFTDDGGKESINLDLTPILDENGLPIYYQDGGVVYLQNEWITDAAGARTIKRLPQGAYILEETAAPLAEGYVQSMAVGLFVEDTSDVQSFMMEDDFTKLEISKVDMTSREEIAGATLTLYEAYRVYDDSDRGWHLEILRDMDEEPIIAEQWVSEGGKPHWIDHIMPGDYILEETMAPTESGYVTAELVEVVIEETGEVQGFMMEDDHTVIEIKKVDGKSGQTLDNMHRATLALYPAILNDNGEPVYDGDKILYDKESLIHRWQTDDGSEVRKTAHLVSIEGGHTYVAYDYDIVQVESTKQGIAYVTETGALRFEYLPVGKYVLVEESAPAGYLIADPMYVPVLDVGGKTKVQEFTMEDEPIRVILTKVGIAGGKEISGATVSIYRAAPDGSLMKCHMKDETGNLLYVTDTDGNLLYDEDGELIPAMEYDEAYLVERWISGSEGVYTKADETAGKIPEGYVVGDVRVHEMEAPIAGDYYFVEEQTPFGYVRAAELPFTIVDTMEIQKIELVDELILGQIEIIKSDEKKPEEKLSDARFRFVNVDTNSAVVLITDEDGRAVSSKVPIGSVGVDGSVSLYHFTVQEIKAPDGYLLDDTVHAFQFNVKTDRYETITYQHEVLDAPSKVVISKKTLTDKEELPGAKLEVREMKTLIGDNGEPVKVEGDVVEAWISTDTPHEIEYLKAGDYVLIETKAPDGFLEAEKVYFTMKENMTAEEIPFVEMFDDDTKTEIKKIDADTKLPLAGVKLELLKADTKEVVKTWTTDETGSIQFMGLPAGDYLVREVSAPEGYAKLDGDVAITVVKDYKVQTFQIENRKIETAFEKRDTETVEFIAGAEFVLLDESGAEAARFTSSEAAVILKGLKAGKYTLKEIKVPDGYLLGEHEKTIQITDSPERQVFTFYNKKIEVDILKTDIETGAALPGAMLRLIREADGSVVREWQSTEIAECFKGLVPGTYRLEEMKAPDGYAVSESQTFEVTGLEEKQLVTCENEKITVEFSKVNAKTGEMLSGAELKLLRLSGQNEVLCHEWISGTETEIIKGLTAGSYLIRETDAPEGFSTMKDFKFEILEDKVKQEIFIKNEPIQIEIEKVSGNTGKLLGGALLQLVRKTDGIIIREWTSREDTPEHFEELDVGLYVVREVKAPAGYKRMEPQEISVKDQSGLQEFLVKNYKIIYSGGGGDDHVEPIREMMELYKVDGTTGERVPGAKITVYRLDGSVYFTGVTGKDGLIRFRKPDAGIYTFKEIEAPSGYYLNEDVFQFTVEPNGHVSGDQTIFNYQKQTVIISKTDVTTAEELPGADIEITDADGILVFKGTSDESGKVYFEAPEPGTYYFREIVAPAGYELNETIFSFTVFEDGSIIGDLVITDEKHYGYITASYESDRTGDGDMTIGELIELPKTGDTTGITGLFMMWLAALAGIIVLLLSSRKKTDSKPKGKQKMRWWMKTHVLLLIFTMIAFRTDFSYAAEEDKIIENIYEEHQYVTEDPDSDEAEALFEKEIERDGKSYRLSEIRTELLKEEVGNPKTIELVSSPFLKSESDNHLPEKTYEQDGELYCLVDYVMQEAVIDERVEAVEKVVSYEAMEALDRIPSRIPVEVTDEATGQLIKGSASFSNQETDNERWDDTFAFPIVVHEYGLDGYRLNDKIIHLDALRPDFTGYERDLLSLIGVDPEFYSVEEVMWDGDSYTDEQGVLCRNALAKGKKLVKDYHVTYKGNVIFPEEHGYRYVSTYEIGDGTEDGAVKYTMKAIGVYVPKKSNGRMIAAIGITSLIAGAGVCGFLYHKKKKGVPEV